MAIAIENPVAVPNEVLVRQATFQTNIVNGKLTVQLVINFQAARHDGNWEDCGGKIETVVIADVNNLEADLAHLQSGMAQVVNQIYSGCGIINSVRKII